MWSEAAKRYATPIVNIFSGENQLAIQLRIEAELAQIQVDFGLVSQEEADLIRDAIPNVKLSRIEEIESEIHHDIMAMVRALAEQSGDASGKVHLGATSSDIKDTVLAIQMVESRILLLKKIDELETVLADLADKHKTMACVGRTHGQFASPTTVGFKFANFLYEMYLARESLVNVPITLSKFSGAVGNYATVGTTEIENQLMAKLGLEAALISTQVLSRTVHAQYLNSMAVVAGVLERISKEIRNLQRSEIREWFEPFSANQVGSSAMPHKRNPHKSERISGISRIIRANALTGIEDIALEHERDITHSSVERIVFPESCNLLYYILDQMIKILSGLTINEEAISAKLNTPLMKTEKILLELVPVVGRQNGHELLRQHVNSDDFKTAVLTDPEILKVLPKDRLLELFDEVDVGLASEKVEEVITFWKSQRQ